MADPLFEVDETVLVQDRGKLYESKILKTKMCNKTWQYFVHYQGWNRKYDCWADEKLIKKKTTEGKISRISGLTVEDSATKKKKVNDEDEIAKKKRKKTMMQSDLLDDDDGNLMTSMKYQVPLTLKKHLVDEWEMIAKAPHRLLKLPRTYTVQTILHEFLAEKGLRGDDSQQTRYRDLFEMLRIYFDKALPLILLYRQERDQFDIFESKWHHPSASFSGSTVYGAEHLLRLFVKLPQLFTQVTVEPMDVQFMQQKFGELLKFIQKNSNRYMSLMDYGDASEVMAALRSSDSSPDAPGESGLMQDGGDGVQDAAIEAGDNDGADLLERAAAMEEEEV